VNDKVNDTDRVLAALGELAAELRRQSWLLDNLSAFLRMAPPEGPARAPGGSRLLAVFALYPRFEREFPWLLAHGFLRETAQGLAWNKSKQSLAEYFGNQDRPGAGRHHWRDIERLFNVKNLANSLSRNGDMFKKTSRNYEALRGLLDEADAAASGAAGDAASGESTPEYAGI